MNKTKKRITSVKLLHSQIERIVKLMNLGYFSSYSEILRLSIIARILMPQEFIPYELIGTIKPYSICYKRNVLFDHYIPDHKAEWIRQAVDIILDKMDDLLKNEINDPKVKKINYKRIYNMDERNIRDKIVIIHIKYVLVNIKKFDHVIVICNDNNYLLLSSIPFTFKTSNNIKTIMNSDHEVFKRRKLRNNEYLILECDDNTMVVKGNHFIFK